LFERAAIDARCVLVHVETAPFPRDSATDSEEFLELGHSAGLDVQAQMRLRRRVPHPRFYFGRGQAEQLQQCCASHEVRLLVLNVDLNPSQERNLESLLQCRVLGRTGLILDIFRAARTFARGQIAG